MFVFQFLVFVKIIIKKKILFNSRYKFYLRYYYTIYYDIILFGKNKYKVDKLLSNMIMVMMKYLTNNNDL